MMWDLTFGNRQAKDFLKKTIDKDMVSHAYLFSGTEGVGKRQFAIAFAAALNCKEVNSPCGVCKVCNDVQRDLPPVRVLQPVGKFITIDQVREVKASFKLKNTPTSVSVLIIDEIEKLNPQAANALLKLIEEPSHNSIVIGITSNERALLPTIISRMQCIPFNPLEDEEVARILHSQGCDTDIVELLCGLFPGSVSRSSVWLRNPAIFDIYENVVDTLFRAGTANTFNPADEAEALFEKITGFSKSLTSAYKDKSREMAEFVGSKYAKGAVKKLEELEKRELDKSKSAILKDICTVFVSFYRDVMIYTQEVVKDDVVNKKYVEYIDACSSVLSAGQVVKLLNSIGANIDNLIYNLDQRLVIETLLFNIREVNSYARGR